MIVIKTTKLIKNKMLELPTKNKLSQMVRVLR